MSLSSISLDSECSGSSRSNSEFCGCSSLEGSVSLPKRTACNEYSSCDGSLALVEAGDSLWCSEYAQDILAYLRRNESSRRPILFKSPQIYHRGNLVALIKRIAESEKLGRTTVHLAVYMLDVFMDTYKVVTAKLNLVTFVCLLIASKIEERDQNIPKICTLNSYTDNQYTRNEFKTLERMVLNFFKWSLLVPTTATFLETFAQHTVTASEIFRVNCQDPNEDSLLSHDESIVQEVRDSCNTLLFEFLELTLNDRRLVHIKPTHLSAACLAASRKVCDITPVWPERLQSLTKCSYEIIAEYVETLTSLRNYVNRKSIDKIKKTPDSGCLTDSESDSQDDDDDVYHCPIPFKRQRLTY